MECEAILPEPDRPQEAQYLSDDAPTQEIQASNQNSEAVQSTEQKLSQHRKEESLQVQQNQNEEPSNPALQETQDVLLKNEESKISQNDPQQEKSKFQDTALEMNLDSIIKFHPHIKNKQELITLIDECIGQIIRVIGIMKPHQTIEKYLKRAHTNKEQMIAAYENIQNVLLDIKALTEQNAVNITLVSEIIYFIANVFKKINFEAIATIDKAIWFLQFQCKVHCSLQFILTSLAQEDDITTWPKEKNQAFWDKVRMETAGQQKKLSERFSYLKKVLGITTTAVIKQQQSDWAISKLVSFGMSYPVYMVNNKQSQLISMRFYRSPKVDLAKKIWNLPENGMTRQMAKLALKNVKTNAKIYIPLNEDKIPSNIFEDDGESIQVRLLYNQDIYLKKQNKKQVSGFSCVCSSSMDEDDFNEITQVILHMHGGGFIALSSRSMQTYTRRWTRKLKVPVFSVDYRMPPDHPFPTAPEDCLKVYRFLLNHINKFFNISPKKIILAGDSAGGNLALSLNGLILKNNLPAPHGIYAAYPAADVRKHFSPSKIHAFTDPLLYPSMLLLCLKQYVGESLETQSNPIASPYLLTEQFIGGEKGDLKFPKKWPRTILHVGAKDPLYDDSVKIAYKLYERGIPYELHVYEDLSHGFLNLDFVIDECKKTVEDSIIHLQKLLK